MVGGMTGVTALNQCKSSINDSNDPTRIPAAGMCFPRSDDSRHVRSTKQLLQDVSTGVVVDKLFSDTHVLRGYVGAFVRMYDAVLASHGIKAGDAALVYKGGNVLVDYFDGLLGQGGYLKAPKRLQALTKRSDTDFTVVISKEMDASPHGREQVLRCITQALYDFKDFLAANGSTYTLPNSAEYSAARDKYNEILATESVSMTGARVVPRPDLIITDPRNAIVDQLVDSQDLRDEIAECEGTLIAPVRGIVDTRGQWSKLKSPAMRSIHDSMYITLNNTLKFQLSNGVGHFDLARLKTNVAIDLTSDECLLVPAELIDVSVSHPDDSKALMDHDIQDWTQVQQFNDYPVLVPTLDYMVNDDLFTILFLDNRFPWTDAKYAKRMARYLVGSALIVADHHGGSIRAAASHVRGQIRMLKRQLNNLIGYKPAFPQPDLGDAVQLDAQFERVMGILGDVLAKVTTVDERTSAQFMLRNVDEIVDDLDQMWHQVALDVLLKGGGAGRSATDLAIAGCLAEAAERDLGAAMSHAKRTKQAGIARSIKSLLSKRAKGALDAHAFIAAREQLMQRMDPTNHKNFARAQKDCQAAIKSLSRV